MEAAAKTVELLTQRTLPDTPYYLSNSPDWRYRPRPDDNSRPEEWHSTRLQYSTLLAEADRGILLTRPDYDMREEPPKPVSRDIASLSKAGGEKKKLSLSDYKNKKTATASTSPPEPSISRLRDSERAVASASSTPAGSGARPTSDARVNSDSRKSLDPRPSDARKPRPDASNEAKPRPKDHPADMSLPPKPPVKNYSLPSRAPSPATKKRVADHDDDARPPKRSRPEMGRSNDDRPSHRDDPIRKRDPSLHGPSQKESSLLNGKSSLKSSSASGKSASPATRPRGDSINGNRPGVAGKSTPLKQDSPTKPVVPPLLSPLRLQFDEDSPSKQEKRRSDDVPARPKKSEQPREERKRRPARQIIPPLLSPTLPPVVEEALLQQKLASAETAARPKQKKEILSRPKKSSSSDESEDEVPREPSRRLIVTLRVFKRLQNELRRILLLPPARNISMSDNESSSRAGRPSTPLRRGNTAMSRVNSNTSTAHTPGEPMNRTPSLGASNNRPTNGAFAANLDANGLREKQARMALLGTRLKHSADNARQGPRSPSVSRDGQPRSASNNQPNPRLGNVLAIESILCFMQGFQAGDMARSMSGRRPDVASWQSLFPFSESVARELLRNESSASALARRNRPLYAVLLQLQAFANDEIIKCHTAQDPPPDSPLNMEVVKRCRQQFQRVDQIRDANLAIENPLMRVDVSAWSTLDDVTEAAMRVMLRWCYEEAVTWNPELLPHDYGK